MKRCAINNWINMALGVGLATLTNHSRGDVVYKKLSAPRIVVATPQIIEAEAPETSENSEFGFRIVKVQQNPEGLTVLITGGSMQGLLPGTTLEVRRTRSQAGAGAQDWIPTALAKILEVRPDHALARISVDGSQLSGIHFTDIPGVMVGDYAVVQATHLARTIRVVPERVLTYDRLFVDPKGFPTSFELTTEGRAYLVEQAKIFVDVHAPLLLIEGHTDHHGDRQTNQIESYQRALTIRQALIEELGLDPTRLVAIGLGETEPLAEPYLADRDREARRIVLKVKNQEITP